MRSVVIKPPRHWVCATKGEWRDTTGQASQAATCVAKHNKADETGCQPAPRGACMLTVRPIIIDEY